MSIRTRLLAIFAVLIGALMAQVGATLYFADVNNELTADLSKAVRNTAEIGGMSTDLQKLRRYEKELFIYVSNEAKRRSYYDEAKTTAAAITDRLMRASTNREGRYTPAEVTRFKAWEADLSFYYGELERIVTQAQTGAITDTQAANTAIGPGKDRLRNFLDGASKDGAERQARAIESAQQLYTNRKIATSITIAITVACALLGAMAFVILSSSVARPIENIADVARRISAGEVGLSFAEHSASEFRELTSALENMRMAVIARRAARA